MSFKNLHTHTRKYASSHPKAPGSSEIFINYKLVFGLSMRPATITGEGNLEAGGETEMINSSCSTFRGAKEDFLVARPESILEKA